MVPTLSKPRKRGPVSKIRIIVIFSRERFQAIKLKRTDTTLDLSQKAKRAKGKRKQKRGRRRRGFINAASAKHAKNTNGSPV